MARLCFGAVSCCPSYRFHDPGDGGYGQSEQVFTLQVDGEEFKSPGLISLLGHRLQNLIPHTCTKKKCLGLTFKKRAAVITAYIRRRHVNPPLQR